MDVSDSPEGPFTRLETLASCDTDAACVWGLHRIFCSERQAKRAAPPSPSSSCSSSAPPSAPTSPSASTNAPSCAVVVTLPTSLHSLQVDESSRDCEGKISLELDPLPGRDSHPLVCPVLGQQSLDAQAVCGCSDNGFFVTCDESRVNVAVFRTSVDPLRMQLSGVAKQIHPVQNFTPVWSLHLKSVGLRTALVRAYLQVTDLHQRGGDFTPDEGALLLYLCALALSWSSRTGCGA